MQTSFLRGIIYPIGYEERTKERGRGELPISGKTRNQSNLRKGQSQIRQTMCFRKTFGLHRIVLISFVKPGCIIACKAMEEQKEEIVGFLHNVSPTKKSSKTSYFDMSIQTTDGLVRGVCFSGSKQEHFDQMSKKKSPIKLRNFRIERAGDATTVLMNNNVLLEPTKEIPFSRIELPSANNIQSISAANTNQSITITKKPNLFRCHQQKK